MACCGRSKLALQHRHRAVVVAVIAMAVVQATVNQVVVMIAVGHQRVAAAIVAALAGDWRAGVGIGRAYREHVLVVVTLVGVMQMAVVQIVHVALVRKAYVSAMLAVDVGVIAMRVVSHNALLFISVGVEYASLPGPLYPPKRGRSVPQMRCHRTRVP